MAEIILAAIAQIYARSERASGNEVIIFQDSADISVAQPGLGRCYLVLSTSPMLNKIVISPFVIMDVLCNKIGDPART